MKRKALFVGVNEYEDPQIRDLNYSLSDAHALKTLFELFGYQTDILENPVKSDVFSAVRKMTSDLSAGDLFFFYFAGHGWTTTTGKHLLFCSDDMYEDLRDDDAGISFDKLKRKTTGEYNRAFVLDACRSDFITGTRGGDTTTRDLRPIGEFVKDSPTRSALAVLRSCSKYEHALEIESRKHGLFTLAMMEVLRSSKEAGVELFFGESLCDAVTQKMSVIARAEGISAAQTPEFAKSGVAQVLISGRKAPPSVSPSAAVSALVICPMCGKRNDPKDTFRCRECGRDNLCLHHQDAKTNFCVDCALKCTSDGDTIRQNHSVKRDKEYIFASNGEHSKFSVVLKDFGVNKQSVLKELQKLYNAGPVEIKRMFKAVPTIVIHSVPVDKAESCKFQLERAGAEVEIGNDGFLAEMLGESQRMSSYNHMSETIRVITISVALLGGTFVLAKLLVWWLFE